MPTFTATVTNTPMTATARPTSTPITTVVPNGQVHVDYVYDSLNRLLEANYSDGRFYHYTYDRVGNRLSKTTETGTTIYTYDIANRLTSVGETTYTYDNNGNLRSDGVNTYAYDSANRLTSIQNQQSTIVYRYDGLGNRLQQTVGGVTTTYTLDLASGLTQVLSDGPNTYLYGNGRIAQQNGLDTEYFLGDALGSVRQLTDADGIVMLANFYDPYGNLTASLGTEQSAYGFTGEQQDSYDL
jgi:YD repeat-containing protein